MSGKEKSTEKAIEEYLKIGPDLDRQKIIDVIPKIFEFLGTLELSNKEVFRALRAVNSVLL